MPRQQKFGQEGNFSRFKSFTFNIRELSVFPTLAFLVTFDRILLSLISDSWKH